MSMLRTKLRVVTDPTFGYKVQYKDFLFWQDFAFPNRHSSLTNAIAEAKRLDLHYNFKSIVVYEE